MRLRVAQDADADRAGLQGIIVQQDAQNIIQRGFDGLHVGLYFLSHLLGDILADAADGTG